MKKLLSGIIALTLFVGLLGTVGADRAEADRAEAADKLPFPDIEKHWAKDTILEAYKRGLVDGYPDGTFKPDAVVKADEFIVMMLKVFSKTTNGKTEFDPEWLDELYMIQPAYTMEIESDVKKLKFEFNNAESGYWAKPYVDFLFEIPYLVDRDLVFPKDYDRFKKQIKREEASYLLGNWYMRFEGGIDSLYSDFIAQNSGLKDFDTFTDYTGKYRTVILMTGLMNGYPNKYFYPQRYVTRAEALTMVLRLRDKSLRKPFKPDLTGQYYVEKNGNITLFSDKFKYDTYNKLVDLGIKNVTTGFLDLHSPTGSAVFNSKDDYEKYDFYTRMGYFERRPLAELGAGVDSGTTRQAFVSYLQSKKLEHSSKYFDAILELYAGNGKGSELKKLMETYERKAGSSGKDIQYFKFNGKDFRMYTSGQYYFLVMSY